MGGGVQTFIRGAWRGKIEVAHCHCPGHYIHTWGLCEKVGDKMGNGPKKNVLNLVKDPDKGVNV